MPPECVNSHTEEIQPQKWHHGWKRYQLTQLIHSEFSCWLLLCCTLLTGTWKFTLCSLIFALCSWHLITITLVSCVRFFDILTDWISMVLLVRLCMCTFNQNLVAKWAQASKTTISPTNHLEQVCSLLPGCFSVCIAHHIYAKCCYGIHRTVLTIGLGTFHFLGQPAMTFPVKCLVRNMWVAQLIFLFLVALLTLRDLQWSSNSSEHIAMVRFPDIFWSHYSDKIYYI